MKHSPALQPGDKIGIAAPSGAVNRSHFRQGIKVLESWGLQPLFRKDIFTTHRFFAGSHARRRKELQGLLDHQQIKAVLFARGGFGLHHILPDIKLSGLKKYPKRLIAYSDLTMLLDRVQRECDLVTYYGPTIGLLAAPGHARVQRDYKTILLGQKLGPVWRLRPNQILKAGQVQGRLVGGCLSLINMSIGTRFEMEMRGAILCLEDINEAPYRYERLLLHLKQSGKLQGVKGLLISSIETGPKKSSATVWKRMLKEVLKDFTGPVVYGFSFGHLKNAYTLPLGARVQLDTRQRCLNLA